VFFVFLSCWVPTATAIATATLYRGIPKTKEEMMSVTRRILIAVGFNQWVQKQQTILMPK
jgi:hypothetical protein